MCEASYDHSIIWNCKCVKRGNLKAPRRIDHFTEEEVQLLLERDRVVEYRYFRGGCGNRVIKIVHCNWCAEDEKYLNRNMK